MKIKVVRRFERYLAPEGMEEAVYDIYHGFTGLPFALPFRTVWKIDKAGMSKDEATLYLREYVLNLTDKSIIIL